MNLSIWDTPSEYYMTTPPRRPFPVMPSLTTKRKGEAPKCKTCKHLKAGNSWCMIMGTVYAPGTCGNTGEPRMNVAYACRGNFKEDKTRGFFIGFQGIVSDETD